MASAKERLRGFLFPTDSGSWLAILRIGLGLQVIFYTWSLRYDWQDLFTTARGGIINRALNEAILSAETVLTPRLGWLVTLGGRLGLTETMTLSIVWLGLLTAGIALVLGLLLRPAAIAAWFLYLCSAKSGQLFAYGVDNFTTIGLFYLMIAPLPDRWSLDAYLLSPRAPSPIRLGFHRRVLQLHLCLIYFFGGISKCLGPEWWNGVSIWRALTRAPFDVIPPSVLIHFTWLLPGIGILVCLLETGYSVFIWQKRTRLPWLCAILLLHVSIGLTMGLYLFGLVMIVLNLAAFGSEFLTRPGHDFCSRADGGEALRRSEPTSQS